MKNIKSNLLIVILIFIFLGCDQNDNDNDKDYENLINLKINEIKDIINNSSSDTISDCRTYFTSSGNSCGPMFIYSINNIDTNLLMTKFSELEDLKEDYYNEMEKQGTPQSVCDLGFPDTIIIVNGKCRACFKNSIDNCEDSSVLFY